MRAISGWLILSIMILTPAVASAQSDTEPNVFWDITRSVVLDPTTYAPATLAYTSMKLDWESSQPLFRHGWVEQNRRFTLSGRRNDVPISFTAGNNKIRQMALLHLQESIINNATANIFERVLTNKYPQHRKLFKVLSWTERIAFASYVSYMASANHFKQAERNHQLALQYGYR